MNVQFDEQYPTVRKQPTVSAKSGPLISLVIKLGIAKNAQQANLILIGATIILVLIFLLLLRSGGGAEAVILDSSIDPETGLEYGVPPAR